MLPTWRFDARSALVILFNQVLLDFFWPCSAFNGPSCQADEAFYFNVQPKGITVPEGSRAFLECNVSNSCNVQFHWVLGDSIVVNTTRRYQNGSNLVITRVNRSLDSGEFHCIATITTTGLAKQSQPAALAILWISQSAAVTALSLPEIRGELQLRCEAEGYDEPTYRWFHNGRRLKKSDRSSWRGRRLTVQAITVNDNGVYSCEAENSAGLVRSGGNFVLALLAANGPSVVQTPADVIVRGGSAALFHCAFEKAAAVYWRKVDQDELEEEVEKVSTKPGSRIRQLANNTLLIDNTLPSDQGDYECVAEGAPTQDGLPPLVQRFAGRLTLASLNEFQSASFEPVRDVYVVGQGKRFQVACIPPNGQPTPEVYWRRNGVRIADEGRVRAVADYTLIIDSARAEDRGEYHCVAENLAGSKWSGVFIHVSRPPVVERHPSSMEVEEGSNAQLDCTFRGNSYPVTLIEWEKDQMPVRQWPKSRLSAKRYFPENGTLLILSANTNDAGEYTCVLKTYEQSPVYSQPSVLRVRERLKFSPSPVDKKLELHSDARIPCRATGFAPAKVKWVQVGTIDPAGNALRFDQPIAALPPHIRDKEGVLSFHRVNFEDSGLYMCLAVSSQGVINVTIRVEVVVAPVFEQVPANVTVEEDQDVWLHCTVRGTPEPTVQWYFEGSPDSEWKFTFRKFANNSLLLLRPSVKQAGQYNCMAGNKGGFKRHEGLVCIRLKSSNISHCGRHVGLQRSFAGRGAGVVVNDLLDAQLQNGITMNTVTIACGAAIGYILLVIALVSYCGYRRRRIRLNKGGPINVSGSPLQLQSRGIANGLSVCSVRTDGKCDTLLPSDATGSQALLSTSSVSSRRSLLLSSLSRLQYRREHLQYMSTMGSGLYGDVYLMKGSRLKDDEPMSSVVVKSLLNRDEAVQAEFLREVELYAGCSHANVARLLAVSTVIEPILVVLEYMDFGNLKHYLQASRHYKSPPVGTQASYPPPLTSAQVLSIACQTASAMEHIGKNRFVHKDLAARNVLLSSAYTIKVTHLSLNGDQFMSEYYAYRNVVMPLRWMPDEALFDGEWSSKSDAWSFGIFLWELCSAGEMPYQALSNDQVIDKLKRAQLHLSTPQSAPGSLLDIVQKCTMFKAQDRPSFVEIRETLEAVDRAPSPVGSAIF